MMLGRFKRAMAITLPGMFLSQPGRLTLASYLQQQEQQQNGMSEVYTHCFRPQQAIIYHVLS
jgi:hypothetical protein